VSSELDLYTPTYAPMRQFLPFPRLRGKVPKAEGGAFSRTGRPLPPFGHLPPQSRGKIRTELFRTLQALISCAALLLILFTTTPAHAIDPLPFKDRAEEVRFQQLTRQLRCLVCQNQDLADSDADLAKDLRRQVFDLMRSGKSDGEIKDYLVARYNDFVLYDPPLKPGTWLLWFAPFALVLIGAIAVLRILRHRARLTLTAAQSETRRSNATPNGEEDW
jgi:cytochrome c-type biogenesis protein CcmH